MTGWWWCARCRNLDDANARPIDRRIRSALHHESSMHCSSIDIGIWSILLVWVARRRNRESSIGNYAPFQQQNILALNQAICVGNKRWSDNGKGDHECLILLQSCCCQHEVLHWESILICNITSKAALLLLPLPKDDSPSNE